MSFILDYLLARKRYKEARRILTWPDAADQEGMINVCIKYNEESLAVEIIRKRKQEVSPDDLKLALDNKLWNLAVELVKWKTSRAIL